jgi:hypothetical protein
MERLGNWRGTGRIAARDIEFFIAWFLIYLLISFLEE